MIKKEDVACGRREHTTFAAADVSFLGCSDEWVVAAVDVGSLCKLSSE